MVTSAETNMDLDQLLTADSEGGIGRRELERATGLWFGEILSQLALRHLSLPRADTQKHYNEAQHRLFEQVFG